LFEFINFTFDEFLLRFRARMKKGAAAGLRRKLRKDMLSENQSEGAYHSL